MTDDMKRAQQIVEEVEGKYQSRKMFLLEGYERAKTEEIVHYKQKDYKKYERAFFNFTYPLNTFTFHPKDSEQYEEIMQERSASRTNRQ